MCHLQYDSVNKLNLSINSMHTVLIALYGRLCKILVIQCPSLFTTQRQYHMSNDCMPLLFSSTACKYQKL